MAVAYRNARAEAGTTYAAVYTVPASTEGVVSLVQLSNIDGTDPATGVGVRWVDDSATANTVLIQDAEIPVGEALDVLGGGALNLEAGDSIEVVAAAAGDVQVTVSVMEVS